MNKRTIVQAFETSEYRARLDKVRTLMSDAGVDALVVISQTNLCYLLGYEGFSGHFPQAALVTLDDDPYFIQNKMDANTATDAGCWLPQDRIEGYGLLEGSWELVGRFLKEKVGASARIGIEMSALSVTDYYKVVGALGVQEPLDGSGLVSACALVKSDRELLYMREAAAIADRAMLAGMDKVAGGTRHGEAAAAIMSVLCAGTESIPGGPPPWLPHIRGGELANAPHQQWMDDVFAAGQQYYLELAAGRHRYPAQLTRMAHLGQATPRLRNQHEVLLAGFLAAVDTLRPGATCGDVARAFQAAIRPYGLTKKGRMGYFVGHSVGYSVGPDWGGDPDLGTNNGTEIVANMTFHVMTCFYGRGEIYLLSDTARVTEHRAELMSTIPHDLFERPA